MAEDKELQDLLDWIKNLPEGITDKKDANKKIAQMRSIAVHVDQTIAKLLNKPERTTTRPPSSEAPQIPSLAFSSGTAMPTGLRST